MKKSAIRETINRLLWDPRYKGSRSHVIEIKHRIGNKEIIKRIIIRDVVSVKAWCIVIKQQGEERIIPFHRIVRIVSSNGEILWSKS